MNGRCKFCNRRVYPERDWQMVSGWEKRRSQGGTNALAGRVAINQWACDECISKIKRGHSPGQEKLI